MRTPKTLAGWCTVLFFLFFGINAFFSMSFFPMLIGILALGAAVFTFIGR